MACLYAMASDIRPLSSLAGRGTRAPCTAALRRRCWCTRSNAARRSPSCVRHGSPSSSCARCRSASLSVTARVTRPGRRVMLLEGSICDQRRDRGRPRAGAPGLPQRASGQPPAAAAAVRRPRAGRPSDFPTRTLRCSPTTRVEIRFVEGAFRRPGPSTAWFRMRHPLVAGEVPSPFERRRRPATSATGSRPSCPGRSTCSSTRT